MTEMHRVQLVRTGLTQTIELPAGFKLPGETALVHWEGTRLIIESDPDMGLLDWLATLEPIEDDFPDFDEGHLPLQDVEL